MSTTIDELDTGALARYLPAHIDGFAGPVRAQKFSGGQSNPTYRLDTPAGRYVLRRKPPGVLLPSAHAVDREYRVMRALADTPVPVPRMHHLCRDDEVLGSAFFVMEYVEGRVLWDATLPDFERADRTALYDHMNEVLAQIHSVDVDAAGLSDFGKAGNYFARQVARWSQQYEASQTDDIPEMDAVMAWLAGHLPDDDGAVALVHGDYRLDNLIVDPRKPRILAVVDWELSTLGHPLADLAYQCMQLRLGRMGPMSGLLGVDRDALGIPDESTYVAAYARRTGRERIDHWPFYLVFSFFRLAAIVQGVKKRALDGNASSERALQVGALVQPLARMAAELC